MGDASTTTIRVSKDTYNEVKALAKERNENIQEIIKQAVKEYKKIKFYEDLNSAYMKLKSTPDAWAEELRERDEWDNTINDGLENENENK